MNCDVTGNPCGTDARLVGAPCTCNSCFQNATGETIVTPDAVRRMRRDHREAYENRPPWTAESEVPPGYWPRLMGELRSAPVIEEDGEDPPLMF